MKIYTVGPISGFSADQVYDYFERVKEQLTEYGYIVFSPLAGKAQLRTELQFRSHGYDNIPIATNHAIFGRDRWMVKQSDVIYANFIGCGDRVSIGSMMELAWAFDNDKHVVIAMEPDNIHRHAFVLEAADIIYESHEKAIAYLKELGKMHVNNLEMI